MTTVENSEKEVLTLEHGAVILATGGREAEITAYGHGASEAIVTQKEFEQRITARSLDPSTLSSVVMIQCAGTREEPKNYCSRICCTVSVKLVFNSTKIIFVQFQVNTPHEKLLGTTNCSLTKN